MLHNTPGQAPAGAPVFLAQGTAVTTVLPAITKQFGDVLCKQGAQVHFVELPGVSHTFRRQGQRAGRPRLDGRPLPRRAGAVELRALDRRRLKLNADKAQDQYYDEKHKEEDEHKLGQ